MAPLIIDNDNKDVDNDVDLEPNSPPPSSPIVVEQNNRFSKRYQSSEELAELRRSQNLDLRDIEDMLNTPPSTPTFLQMMIPRTLRRSGSEDQHKVHVDNNTRVSDDESPVLNRKLSNDEHSPSSQGRPQGPLSPVSETSAIKALQTVNSEKDDDV